jgi:unsaturated rhamnogalacturonyl hydrolase
MARYAPEDASWRYEDGLFLASAIEAGEAWGDRELGLAARQRVSSLVGPEGSIRGYRAEDFNLDMVNSGKNLFRLYRETGERRFEVAIEALASQLALQPRTPSGGLWHKLVYPDQMWLDGLYMAQPFMARYAIEFDRPELFGDIAFQFALVAEKARDPRTGLLRHAWDERGKQLWADPETGRSPNHWGRAMGWYAMALADALEILPPSLEGAEGLRGIFRSLAEALAAFQDELSGLWYQVVDRGGREGNYLEASASAMLAYAFLKGSRLGLLDPGRFVPLASRAYEGVLGRFLRLGPGGEAHLEGICGVAGLGGSPYRDGSYEYYVGEPTRTDDFKGVGPFVLASVEYCRRALP